MPMPELKKTLADCEMEDSPRRCIPKPLINMPNLTISVMNDSDSDGSDSDESDSAEDVMTAEEEAAARRYLSGASGAQTEQRRMSSLDVYLMQPQAAAESMIINKRLSMRDEENEIARMNSEEYLRQQEEIRQEKLRKERESVKLAREAKAESKMKNTSSPSPRRSTFRKRGIGGLSKDRRKKLREIIMRKAREELQAERTKEMMRREEHLKSVVPTVDLDSMNAGQLEALITQLHHQARESLVQCIELEDRLRKQDEEICRMTREMIDLKGKYPKPILRKVRKTETILAKLDRLQKLNAIHHIRPETALKHTTNRANNLVNGNCGESQRH